MHETSSNAQTTAAVQHWLETPGCQEEARAAVEDIARPRGRERINPKARGLNYSHSFTCVCSDANPVDSRLVVSLGHLATESRRVSSRRRLGQNVGQRRKLFAIEGPQFHFCLRDKNRQDYRLQTSWLRAWIRHFSPSSPISRKES